MDGPFPPVIETFAIDVGDDVLSDLRARMRHTRWPPPAPGTHWQQGTDLDFLQKFLEHWAEPFDWRKAEIELNSFRQFRAAIDGVRVHFVHERARRRPGIPLILTHGWPSAFIEYLPLVPLLTDPAAHGIDGPSFDLVIPSLPGYGFSGRPAHANYRTVAHLWHRLMRALGYERYGAGGGDFGAGVTTLMALDQPQPLIGIHLSNLELSPYLGEGTRPLSPAERAYLAQRQDWDSRERGYTAIQSTKPQTLGYGLHDSPAALAAWIVEKWRSWGDTGGDVERRFSREFLLRLVTLYWVTGTITTSMRDYFDNRWRGVTLGRDDFVRVPTGIARFAKQFVFEGEPPREWAERLYDVRRWTPMPRGGHFAAVEEPDLLARDIATFFADL
jgi:pimeloyl-ACP methyl ester carboxylesterase